MNQLIQNKYFSLAKEISKHSNYKIKIGAVIVKGSRILSIGYNQKRHKAIGLKYTDWAESLHAERDAISKLNRKVLKGSSIYIYREHKETKMPMLSKPCPQCSWLIRDMKIKRFYYSTPDFPYFEVVKL